MLRQTIRLLQWIVSRIDVVFLIFCAYFSPLKRAKNTSALSRMGLCVFCYLSLIVSAHASDNWHNLKPGLAYQDLATSLLSPWSHIHVFRIDLSKYRLESIFASALAKKFAYAEEFAEHTQALIAINGGFFDKNYLPLGLRISQFKQKNPLKRISWWGIFYTQHNKAYMTNVRAYSPSPSIDFALQSGPRLIVNGQIPSLKPGIAERTALGISKKGEVIVLVTENNPLSTKELASLMQAPPLDCQHALNLDGGSSSQLQATIDDFHVHVHRFANVSDAVIIKAR